MHGAGRVRGSNAMTDTNDTKKHRLRSEDWLNNPAEPDQTALYVERFLNFGLTRGELQAGRPIIGIAQTGSDLNPCNRHHLDLAKRVRDGIRDAGGIALEFPVHPLAEQARRPTAALDRNLAFLGLVEILHGYPIDGVVLTTGCDKTTPACIMAAAALDLPAIVLSGGPMVNAWDDGERVGSGAVIWQSRLDLARGDVDYEGIMERVTHSAPSAGHCNTMGTALTMNAIAEVIGMSLPGCAAIPATYQARGQMAYHTGRRAVELVREDLRPSTILTRDAMLNAIVATSALGGSSNAPIHLQAIAAQLDGVDLSVRDWQTYGESVPLLVNCQPAGEYLGEDFYRAGGVPAVLGELLSAGLLQEQAATVSGHSIGENNRGQSSRDAEVIRPVSDPLMENAGFAVLSGNLFDSAVMKKSVISEAFRNRYLRDPERPNVFHSRVIVFEGSEDYHRRINDPALGIDERCMLVIRNCGPLGYPGSAEVVNMLPPDRLVRQGIHELPCMGDGRQSGTSACPAILNASPEAAAGGGLALLRTGDTVEVDLEAHTVNVLLDEAEMARRREAHKALELQDQTPWQEIYRRTVGPLERGAVMELDSEHVCILERHGTPRHSH
jgi:dihydroxy-acid dehydratase